ncbi:efflux RND transporter periplasmic adaptor subunit [Arboricoccus pini]|nr:efflux RND transporter periplasmic adaptor subunit [Arboricoccus pini]
MRSAFAKLVLAGSMLIGVAGCGEQKQQAQQAPPPVAVGVVTIKPAPVTAGFNFIGRVEAINTVTIRARVEGYLEKQNFVEGQEVKKGDLLFSIEKQVYQAQVAQAQAQVLNNQAVLANAEAEFARSSSLVRNNNISQSTVDSDRAARDQAIAQVSLAQAQAQQAKINLGYTDIYAPIDGKIGAVNYDVGNLVNSSSNPLVTLVSQDPMYVTFPVSAVQLADIRDDRQQGGGDLSKIEFVLTLANGKTYAHTGHWNFTSPQVDPQTDTVVMRATFPNPDRALIDSEYVNVTLRESEPKMRLLVPQAAVQTVQGGSQVLVVNSQNKVEARSVELGQVVGPMQTVTSGLKEGERVILEGLQKARAGSDVKPTEVEPPKGAPAASGGSGQGGDGKAADQSGSAKDGKKGSGQGTAE